MKKIYSLFIILLMLVNLTGCGNGKNVEDVTTLKSDYMSIEGIYVEDSYVDSDNESLKLVYLFYELTPTDENLKVDSKSTTLKIGNNEYTSDRYLKNNSENYIANYYYSDYLEDVYVGNTLKILETFKIPVGDLNSDKEITLINKDIPDIGNIKISTKDLIHLDTFEEIAEKADNESYLKESNMRSDADSDATKKAKNALNGYYWTFYVNNLAYKLEFYAPNNFDITTSYLSNSGTYYVKNGYIAISYDNGKTFPVYIAYEYNEDGEIELYLTDAFDVRE